jgi:Skp family chaperone for outer membrane proteins
MNKILAFVAATLLTASAAVAQQIGVVDSQRVTQSYYKFQTDSRSWQQEESYLVSQKQAVQERIGVLIRERDAALQDAENPALSADRVEAARALASAKEREAMQNQQNFEAQVSNFQARVQQSQNLLAAEINDAIDAVAKLNNLDVVLNSQIAPYAKIDITEQVIETLNKNQPAPAAAPAAASAAQ